MNQPTDPQRHGPAAQADLLGDDARIDGAIPDPAPRPDAGKPTEAEQAPGDAGLRSERGDASETGEARAGMDINQSGFLKDRDAAKP